MNRQTMKNSMLNRVSSLLLLCSLLFSSVGSAQDRTEEYELKAVLLGRLLQFVTWPESLENETSSFCVVGENPFSNALNQAFSQQEIQLAYLTDPESRLENCKAVYFAESELRALPRWLEQIAGLPILTISDIPRFALSGGMINLTFENRRVRFRINKSVADSASLNLSFQLLNLSEIVETQIRRGTP